MAKRQNVQEENPIVQEEVQNVQEENPIVQEEVQNVQEETVILEEPVPAEPTLEELKARIAALEAEKAELQAKSENKAGRKSEVLKYLQTHGHVRVRDIAISLGISERNVSSQMTYLRKDGHSIATDSRGYKFLEIAE